MRRGAQKEVAIAASQLLPASRGWSGDGVPMEDERGSRAVFGGEGRWCMQRSVVAIAGGGVAMGEVPYCHGCCMQCWLRRRSSVVRRRRRRRRLRLGFFSRDR